MVERYAVAYADWHADPEGGFVDYNDYAALKAENDRLKLSVSAWEDSARINKARAEAAERALAERAGEGKVHREDVAKLVYEAMSWAAMCGPTPNGTVPVWEDRGNSLGQEEARHIADRILSALEPAAPEGRLEARPSHCGGCGETDPGKRCIGCLADFGPTRPAEQAVTEEWREIKQHVQPRIADGYTAVAVSKPGYWFVKGPGPAPAQKEEGR